MNSNSENGDYNEDNSLIATSVKNILDSPPWRELFSPAVEKIYSFLNQRDQKSMSLVCRNWRKEYCCLPSIWRILKFSVPNEENNTELCPDIMSAWSYGSMFHHVTVYFLESDVMLPFNPDILPVALNQLKFFMEALTQKSQLLSISFQNFMCSYFGRPRDEAANADVYRMLMNFLKSQKKLQYVEFDDCPFKTVEAAEILKAVCMNNSRTLRHLHLNEFVGDWSGGDFTVDEDLNFLVLMNLEILSIDYNQVFEKMIASFCEYRNRADIRKGRLKKIKLFLDDRTRSGLDPLVWEYFIRFFPDLSVDLTVSCDSDNLMSIYTLIVPQMLLKELRFILYGYGSDMEIGLLLSHITSCGANECLEVLEIAWYTFSSLAPDLISFTSVCPKLKAFQLEILHPVPALDTVFKYWMERRPKSIDSVQITVIDVPTQEEKTAYTNLSDFFAPFFRTVGIEFSVNAKLMDTD